MNTDPFAFRGLQGLSRKVPYFRQSSIMQFVIKKVFWLFWLPMTDDRGPMSMKSKKIEVRKL